MKRNINWLRWPLATVTLIWIINGIVNAIQNL